MEKVIRDGMVAVLYSSGYGAGWYSWNTHSPECLFHPTIVELVEQKKQKEITTDLCDNLFGDRFYSGGAQDLYIQWIPIGTAFQIHEYDGSESIELKEHDGWIIA